MPEPIAIAVVPESLYGVRMTVVLFASFRSVAADVFTVTSPEVLVVILSTYLVPEPVETSQPHALSAGSVDAAVLCTVSVILVRQADAARITSDTFARIV